jgi:hypothetical protein
MTGFDQATAVTAAGAQSRRLALLGRASRGKQRRDGA